MDQFFAIFETNIYLISILLTIIQGYRVGIVSYKESVIFICLFFFSRFFPKILDAKYIRYRNDALPTLLLTLTSKH